MRTPVRSVLVVGGGAIGCGIARELAARSVTVTVVERGEPGSEASGAAAGLLAPQAEGLEAGPLFDLAIASRGMYPVLARDLAAETGIDVGWRPVGILRCDARGDSDFSRYLRQRETGLAVEEAGRESIARLSGGLVDPGVPRALFFREDGIVDPRKLTRALWLSAERRGVRFRLHTEVARFRVASGACRGIDTSDGPLEADAVVDAAGAWAAFDPAAGVRVPVEPVRGQIVELRPEGPTLPCAVQSDEVYLVPRADGSLLVGSTTEHVGFRKEVTAEAVERLIASARGLVPTLSRAGFTGAWAGLRPGSEDGAPLIGESDVPGLFLAAGHYRNGILLAPATARLLADALLGDPPAALGAFSPRRFVRKKREHGTAA